MPPKRASDEAELSIFSKLQRIGDAVIEKYGAQEPLGNGHEFSSSVKRKLADSKRTGQACDRCKVRKIRCDGRPEGCTPCEQNRTPCRTTDRITGRATTRGQVEAMESEVSQLRSQIADLQAQLKENGIEPRVATPFSGIQPQTPAYQPNAHTNDRSWSNAPRRTSSPSASYTPVSATEKLEYRILPQFKHGSIGDNYLGVGVGDTRLSHIRGTSLSIFGTDIDIADYMQGDYENSVMSYSSLVSISLRNEPAEPVPLPPYHSLKEYAMWYLRSLNPYTMLVHKPAFLELVNKFGNDPAFQPTVPQIVMVHMMLSSIQYQIATRNSQSIGLLEESHKHYKYALSFYKQLTHGKHNLEDVQALGMICHHLRNFPRPGAAWIMTSITYLFALELGLHRSVKNWKDGYSHLSKLEIEMRKRLFWTLNALQVNLNGKLGRPMPISNDDIDVEFPEPMNDCLPGEEEMLDEFHRCSFQVGIQIAKYTVLEVDLYKMIYSVRSSPTTYLERMKTLEMGIKRWKAELPYELRDPAHASQDDTIFCLYLEYWYQAFNLSLHHPAVCRSLDPAVMSSNLDACHEASQKMLQNCNEMMQKKSLDIPWINTVVYVAAIFTTLYISSIRHAQTSPADFATLKDDMIIWINVLGECDHFLGSGDKLKTAIAQIIDQSLHNISDNITKRTASESIVGTSLQVSQQPPGAASMYESGGYREQYVPASVPTDPALTTTQTSPAYENMAGAINHPYDMGSTIPLQQQSNNMYDQQQPYSTSEDAGMTSTHAAALVSATNPTSQAPNNYNTYAHPHNDTHNPAHTQHIYAQSSFAPQDWRQWTRTYMQPPSQALGQPGDYLNTATTLMALGGSGRDGTNGGTHNSGSEGQSGSLDGVSAHGSHGHVHGVGGQVHAHWPEIVFSGGMGSTSGVGINGHLS